MDNPQQLAEAETYIIHVLESSNPRREASGYNVTATAQECHEISGNWNRQALDRDTLEEVLAKHAKTA